MTQVIFLVKTFLVIMVFKICHQSIFIMLKLKDKGTEYVIAWRSESLNLNFSIA